MARARTAYCEPKGSMTASASAISASWEIRARAARRRLTSRSSSMLAAATRSPSRSPCSMESTITDRHHHGVARALGDAQRRVGVLFGDVEDERDAPAGQAAHLVEPTPQLYGAVGASGGLGPLDPLDDEGS